MKIFNSHLRARFFVSVLIFSLVILPSAPTFAQLGGLGGGTPLPPPTPPAVDLCPNIDGTQETIPSGMILNGSGNCVTPIPADTTPPAIADVANLSLGLHEATFIWTTDELAVSTFEYGKTTSYGGSATLDATALLAHTAILTGLDIGTTYYYCIHATDLAGNIANSCGHSFTTASETILEDTTPPDVTSVAITGVSETSATIAWTTDEIANSQIEYGMSALYGEESTFDSDLALLHSVTLTSLTPDTIYHYRIRSSDEIGNTTFTPDETFTTEAIAQVEVSVPRDTTVPVISGVGHLTLGINDATIVWETNELSTSALEYGTTTSYGSHATLSLSALLAHSATLTDLLPSTTYYYCLHATDLSGNTANSCGHSFLTNAAPIVVVTPPADTTSPEIFSSAVVPAEYEAVISWTTNEPAKGQVEYGTTTSYGSQTALSVDLALFHTATISSLLPGTEYHYRIVVTDEMGNTTRSADETFMTVALPSIEVPAEEPTTLTPTPPAEEIISSTPSPIIPTDTTPPEILSPISTSTETSVIINWTTSELSDGQVTYGPTDEYGQASNVNENLLLNHTVTLNGLDPDTTYHFKIFSADASGNLIANADMIFVTLGMPLPEETEIIPEEIPSVETPSNTGGIPTPVITSLTFSQIEASTIGENSVTVTWTTSVPANSKVEYGLSAELGLESQTSEALTTSHSVVLTNLSPGTNYIFRVLSEPALASIPAVSENYEFNTLAESIQIIPPANILSVSSSDITSNSAQISWTTDKGATSQIEYGFLTDYGNESALDTILNTSHSISLSNLEPATTYHFRVKSVDADDNETFSEDYIFTTLALSGQVVSPSAPVNENENVEQIIVEPETNVISAGGGSGGRGSGGSTVITVNAIFPPTMLKAEPLDGQIMFFWNNPDEANFSHSIIVRKEGSYPASLSDGVKIYAGIGETFTDTFLSNGKNYYYAIYSLSNLNNHSAPIHVSLAPQAGRKEVQFDESGVLEKYLPALHFTKIFKRGDRDIEIEHLQEVLIAEGDFFPKEKIYGVFGPLTEKGLKKFQAQHNLKQTGIVDKATQNKLNIISQSKERLNIPEDYALFSTDIKRGAKGETVKALQQYLVYEGSLRPEYMTGTFGPETKKAVMLFQKKYGVKPPEGYVGYKTRHKMQDLAGL